MQCLPLFGHTGYLPFLTIYHITLLWPYLPLFKHIYTYWPYLLFVGQFTLTVLSTQTQLGLVCHYLAMSTLIVLHIYWYSFFTIYYNVYHDI